MARGVVTEKEREGFLAFSQGKRNPPGFYTKEEARQWRLGNDRARAEAEGPQGLPVPSVKAGKVVRVSFDKPESVGEMLDEGVRREILAESVGAESVEKLFDDALEEIVKPLIKSGRVVAVSFDAPPEPPAFLDMFPPIHESSPAAIEEDEGEEVVAHEQAPILPEHMTVIPKKRGTWWESKSPEDRARITAQRLAARGLSPKAVTEPKRKGPKRSRVRNRTAEEWKEYHRIWDAKKTVKQYIARLEFHGLPVPEAARQRAADGVTPFHGERINTLVYKRDQAARQPSPAVEIELGKLIQEAEAEEEAGKVVGVEELRKIALPGPGPVKVTEYFDTCIPMRQGWTLGLRLPFDFNMKEAERIARVLVAYAKHPITQEK